MNWAFDITLKNRKLMALFLDSMSIDQLNKIPIGFNNNIFWNIAHLVATQQQLVYGLSGLPMNVSDSFVAKYKKGSKPEENATKEEVEELKGLLFSTIKETEEDYGKCIFKDYNPYTTSTESTIKSVEEAIEFNNFHEGIHLGYILALKKLL